MKPLFTFRKPVKVGIYDSAYVLRLYKDKAILISPSVSWAGNSGGYSEVKLSIREPDMVAALHREAIDDCDDSLWNIVGRATGDDYLIYSAYN